MRDITYIDLFAGCGGFSCGLERAGLAGVLHLEKDTWACETLAANFSPATVMHADIREIPHEVVESYRGVDIIVGGPPCQGFSVAGSTQFGVTDPRNELVLWYLKWVETVLPLAAVIENVPGILTKKDKVGKTVLDIVRERLQPLGYKVQFQILNAIHFGVPQSRNRAFLFCTMSGFRLDVSSLVARVRHRSDAQHELFQFTDISAVTVFDALSDLPTIGAGEGSDAECDYASPPMNLYQARMRKDSGGVHNHVAMKHSQRLIERFATIKPGCSLKDVHPEYGQVRKLDGGINLEPYKYNNYRLDPTKPALTIPASFQSLFLHPTLDRNLTAREAARLMSFPDHFVFKGKRTTMSWEKNLSQYNQIGNSVCPLVAEDIGIQLRHAIAECNSHGRGAFVFDKCRVNNLPTPGEMPKVGTSLPSEIRASLRAGLTRALGKLANFKETISHGGFEIPTETLPLALLFSTQADCPICRHNLAPHGSHCGEMIFLISKDSLDSLWSKEQDHSLDFHLRRVLNIDHQVGHFVGEQLVAHGLAEEQRIENPRTGRLVRGIRVQAVAKPIEELRTTVMAFLKLPDSANQAKKGGGVSH